MFDFDADAERLADRCFDYVRQRLTNPPDPVAPPSVKSLAERVGPTITPEGIGSERALDLFANVLAPAAIPLNSPKHCALIPGASTVAATLFDACVSATALVAEAWIEAAGGIHPPQGGPRWVAAPAGMPQAGGGGVVGGGAGRGLSPPRGAPRPA